MFFAIDNFNFGINICYDTQFPEATARLTEQGAKMMLCVSNTMMSLKKAGKFKLLHLPMRAERAREKQIWILSADVTGEQEARIAYGTTSAINPVGEITDQVPFLNKGMIIKTIQFAVWFNNTN